MSTLLSESYNDNREWIIFVSKWFLFAMVFGGLTYLVRPDLIDQILGMFQSKFGPEPARDVNFAKEIFLQNSMACLLALAGGVIFGISSFVIVFFNGFIIGFVVMLLLLIPGNPIRNIEYIVLGLLPHGIFELPAFILASALGIRLGTEWLNKYQVGHRWETFKANTRRALSSVPLLAFLLLIAAFIEVFVSGHFVENFR